MQTASYCWRLFKKFSLESMLLMFKLEKTDIFPKISPMSSAFNFTRHVFLEMFVEDALRI